jgi:hypothetical protein
MFDPNVGAFILPDGFIAGIATYCRIFITGMIIAGFPVGPADRELRGYLNLRKKFRKIGSTLLPYFALAAAFCFTRSIRSSIVWQLSLTGISCPLLILTIEPPT